jgi:hypothetical protein
MILLMIEGEWKNDGSVWSGLVMGMRIV